MKKTKIFSTAASVATAGVGVFAAGKAAKTIKDKKFCPVCSAKKLINKAFLNQTATNAYNNGVALTPPMGWSSWNLFRNKINEDLIKEIADAMIKSGLSDVGYTYVNIDDCWQASERDSAGRLQWDKINFRSGIPALAQYVNSLGLKLGIYSSNGTLTCEDYPASLRHEAIDADTFAEWGIEYFKYDFCHNKKIPCDAPKICSVSLGVNDATEIYYAKDFSLSGMARLVSDNDVDGGCYVDGLDSRNGSFSISYTADKETDCALCLTVRKTGIKEKFVTITVNGKDEYHVYVPGTKGWTPEGKALTTIKLYEGENNIVFSNPVGSAKDSAAIQYKLMGRELKRATKEFAERNNIPEKPIVYSICEWGLNNPWKWGSEAGNLWRTTPDIKAIWGSVLGIYELTVRLAKYASCGGWNDPDMLEVGNGSLTYEENKSHFSLWCMMCAPLILGNDIRKFIKEDGTIDTENNVYKILTNKAMISINQDKLGVQCKRIKTGVIDILVKPLENNKAAICVFNKGNSEKEVAVDFNKIANEGNLNIADKKCFNVYDVWEDIYLDKISSLTAKTQKHGVKVYVVE
ncbi:MAG: alpha-galactosidase [Clostridia bacterium]|nr:alpha-galactosidase [Clostridia bacterium]